MKSVLVFVLLVQMLLIRLNSLATINDPIIYSVSSSATSYKTPIGSIQGGLKIYLFGNNFNNDPSKITILIGPYPCILGQTASTTLVTCVNTAATNISQISSLPVTIRIEGKIPVTCSTASCKCFYNVDYTPLIYAIFPSTTSPLTTISSVGMHRISDIGDGTAYSASSQLNYILVGSSSCSLLGYIQTVVFQQTNPIKCTISKNSPTGQYAYIENSVNGNAKISARAFKYSFFTAQNYVVRVLANITNFNFPHIGGTNGHNILLNGVGFSLNQNDYSCRIAGHDCKVRVQSTNAITIQIPVISELQLDEKFLIKDMADGSTQQEPYVGNHGFRSTRYKNGQPGLLKSPSYWYNQIKQNISSLTVIEDTIITELGQVDLSYSYVSYVRGYLSIPTTGNYTFFLLCDDNCIVKMATYQNNTNQLNMQTFMEVDSFNNDRYNPYITSTSSSDIANTTQYFEKGYYYIEIVHSNNYGPGFYKLSMQMPPINSNSSMSISNPTYQIDHIVIQPIGVSPEVIRFVVDVAAVNSASNGMFKLGINLSSTLTYSATFNLGDNSSTFLNKFNSFPSWYSSQYSPIATLKSYNQFNIPTNVTAQISQYVYEIIFNKVRTPSISNPTFPLPVSYPLASGVIISTLQAHSPPVAGTYQILDQINHTINGSFKINNYQYLDTDFPSGLSLAHIQDALNYYYNSTEIQVTTFPHANPADKIQYFISYYGISNILPLSFNTTQLSGGINNQFKVTQQTYRQYSQFSPYYQSIPLQFLYLAENSSSFSLAINSLPVLCGNCTYTYNSSLTPVVASCQLNFNVLELELVDQGGIGFTIADINQISLFGVHCSINPLTTSNITHVYCQFGITLQNKVDLPYGSSPVKVHIYQVGNANTTTIAAINVALIASVMIPNESPTSGKIQSTITGSGLPIINGQLIPGSTIEISLCGVKGAKILTYYSTTSSLRIKVPVFPNADATNSELNSTCFSNSYLKVNNITLPLQFTYITTTFGNLNNNNTALEIIDLSFNSASPIRYDILQIGLDNLDGNSYENSSIAVYLDDISSSNQIELSVIGYSLNGTTNNTIIIDHYIINNSINQSNIIYCLFEGAPLSSYNVRVNINNILTPISPLTIFKVEVVIESISPSAGSLGGGYNLTLLGINFDFDGTLSYIYIGQIACPVLLFNSTTIICQIPKVPSLSYANKPLEVSLYLGHYWITSCLNNILDNSCTFMYDSALTFFVKNLTQNIYNASDIVTIHVDMMAFNNTNGDVATSVQIGGIVVPFMSQNESQLTFAYPALQAGTYDLAVILSNNGSTSNAYPYLLTETLLFISGTLSMTSSSTQGRRCNITGNGMSSNINNGSIRVYLGCGLGLPLQLSKIYQSPTRIQFQISRKISNPQCTITYIHWLNTTVYGYNYYVTSTPIAKVNLINSTNYTFFLNYTNFIAGMIIDYMEFVYVDYDGYLTNSKYQMTFVNGNTTSLKISPKHGYLPIGVFIAKIHSLQYGYTKIIKQPTTYNYIDLPTISNNGTNQTIVTSFNGGNNLTISGSVFITTIKDNNYITVCDRRVHVVAVSESDIVVEIPKLISNYTQLLYNITDPSLSSFIEGMPFSDPGGTNTQYAFDGFPNTYYYSSLTNGICYVGLDFGINMGVRIRSIRYIPYALWSISSLYLQGAVIEGSNDGVTYSIIAEVDASVVHSGLNFLSFQDNFTNGYFEVPIYRYVRFRHNGTSNCMIAQLQVQGHYLNVINDTVVMNILDYTCDVNIYNINGDPPLTITQAVKYSHGLTAVVNTVSPQFGSVKGGTVLTIQGYNFNEITLTIDHMPCIITFHNSTVMTCITQPRPIRPIDGCTFIFLSNAMPAIMHSAPFLYVSRSSDPSTWNHIIPPKDIVIRKGINLYIDQQFSSIVNSVKIKAGGKLIFSDEGDYVIKVGAIMVMEAAEIRIGTQYHPYQHNLQIVVDGQETDQQMYKFGNKVIGCQNCMINIHGQIKRPAWTTLASTITPGAVNFTIQINNTAAFNWQKGQTIIVSSSSFNHLQSQSKQITNIHLNATTSTATITVSKPFSYAHYSQYLHLDQQPGQGILISAEVGILSRNIKIQGNVVSPSTSKYGVHMIVLGDGGMVKISGLELSQCGQPMYQGRYCLYFQLNSFMPESYMRDSSCWNSYARFITVEGTSFLEISNNVGFMVQGHNIFLQDGSEMSNLIFGNLMVSALATSTILGWGDITVSSFKIRNPYNLVYGNVAAGGDYYGFLYQLPVNADGASANLDLCPQGMSILDFQDNIAHSNLGYGFSLNHLISRKHPCISTIDETLLNPFAANTIHQAIINNLTLWRNVLAGALCQELGNVILNNFKLVDNLQTNLQVHKTNYTAESTLLNNSIFIGYSNILHQQSPLQFYYNLYGIADGGVGLITPRSDGFSVNEVLFVNYTIGMSCIKSCSECDDYRFAIRGGKTTTFSNVRFVNVTGQFIYWAGWRTQIFIDLDGTLSSFISNSYFNLTASAGATLTPFNPTLLANRNCYNVSASSHSQWNDSIYCNGNVQIRAVTFWNLTSYYDFRYYSMRVRLLNGPYDNSTTSTNNLNLSYLNSSYLYSSSPTDYFQSDIPYSFTSTFLTNQIYNIHWSSFSDFLSLTISLSNMLWTTKDSLILRFNCTAYRDMYNVYEYYALAFQDVYLQLEAMLELQTCKNGEYFYEKDMGLLFLCVSGRQNQKREILNVQALPCVNYCPQVYDKGKENFTRVWSNLTQWPLQRLPRNGENVSIPFEWNLVLDVSPPDLYFLQIKGYLFFDRSRNITLRVHIIYVSLGTIFIGSKASPYINYASIILLGEQLDPIFSLDRDAYGNKMLLVTGGLEFYGKTSNNQTTVLLQSALKGNLYIVVSNAFVGWTVGQHIVIAGSYGNQQEDQIVSISFINGNIISITNPLQFQHYGALKPIVNNSIGIIDGRSSVGLLTKNIKISKESNSSWGCFIHISSYLQTMTDSPYKDPVILTGYANFQGVEIEGCGQSLLSGQSLNPALKITKLSKYSLTRNLTTISKTSIHSCLSMCLLIDTSANISITNSVFYDGYQCLVRVLAVNLYNFTNNLLLKAKNYSHPNYSYEHYAVGYEQYYAAGSGSAIQVTKNVVQGSEGVGFILPFMSCNASYAKYYSNSASSCQIGFIFTSIPNQTCFSMQFIASYQNQIAILSNPYIPLPPRINNHVFISKAITFNLKNILLVDNQIGIIMKTSLQAPNYQQNYNYNNFGQDISVNISNSYFNVQSRPNCSNCYGVGRIQCDHSVGIMLYKSYLQNQTKFPLKNLTILTNSDGYGPAAFNAKLIISHITFQNYYFNSLANVANTKAKECLGSVIFKADEVSAIESGSIYLSNVSCVNCENVSWVQFNSDNNNPNRLDSDSFLIQDGSGSLSSSGSQMVPLNALIGQNEPSCTLFAEINGYLCVGFKFAILEYESISPDYFLRAISPITLHYDNSTYTTTTNPPFYSSILLQPNTTINATASRFKSIIKVNQTYNIHYKDDTPPVDTLYQFQDKANSHRKYWLIVKVYYNVRSFIQVHVTNSTNTGLLMKPFATKNNISSQDLTQLWDHCGANIYHEQNMIQFVLNNLASCQVRLTWVNCLHINTVIDLDFDTFITDNGMDNFTTEISTFLGISEERVMIVNIMEGSTVISAFIVENIPSMLMATNTARNTSNASLQNISNTLLQAIQKSNYFIQVSGEVLTLNSQVVLIPIQACGIYLKNSSSSISEDDSSSGNSPLFYLLIGMISSIPFLLCLYMLLKRRRCKIYNKPYQKNIFKNQNNILKKQKKMLKNQKSILKNRKNMLKNKKNIFEKSDESQISEKNQVQTPSGLMKEKIEIYHFNDD